MVAVTEVPDEETSRYGVIAGERVDEGQDQERTYRMTGIVEKPAPGTAPSNLAVIGRYVLTPKIFDKLEQTQRGRRWRDPADRRDPGPHGGAERLRLRIRGHALRRRHHDGLAPASVELALARPEFGSEFRAYLRSLDI